MKKTAYLSFVPIAFIASTIAYAQAPNPLYQHLPPSANHIYSIRLGQIIAKGQLLDILNTIPPPKSPDQAGAFTIIKDPAAAGIDLNHEILVAQTTAGGTGADTVSYMQILLPLTDSSRFRTTLAALFKEAHIHRVPGKGATIRKDKIGMAWNDRLVVITTASSIATMHKPAPTVHRSLDELALEKSLAALAGFPTNPLLADQRFIAGFSTDEDVHSWSTKTDFMSLFSKFAKKMAAKNPAMQGKSFPEYSNNSSVPRPPVLSTFNFADGRIMFRSKMFYKPDDAASFRRLTDRPIDKDLLARVPAGLLLGAAVMHLNTSAIPDLMDKYHTRQKLDSMLAKKGLSVTDITSALGGDFMVAILADTTAGTDTAKKKINVYFVATLGDPAKLMQLASKMAADNGAAADTAQVAKLKKLLDKMVIRNNTLVISGSKAMAESYFTTPDRRSTSLLDDSKGMQTFVVDLKACSRFIETTMSNEPKAMLAARVFEKLDRIQFDNGAMDGDNMVLTFQIVTGDPSTNSLKTLVSLLH